MYKIVIFIIQNNNCGSMCWPVDRPATHAAAGAAARGVRGIGGFFCGLDWEVLTTGLREHAAGGVTHEEWSDTHAASGETARGGFWGILLRLDWEPLREHVLAGGPASHACRRGSGSTRGGGCGGKRWPVDRQYEGFLIYAHPPPPRKKTRRSRDKSQDRRALLSP